MASQPLEQLRPGHDLLGSRDQVFEHRELPGGQGQQYPAAAYLAASTVDLQVGVPQDRRASGAGAPAEAEHPGGHLLGGERLDITSTRMVRPSPSRVINLSSGIRIVEPVDATQRRSGPLPLDIGQAQLVCWQLAAVAAGLGTRQRLAVAAPVVSGAVLLVLLTSTRYRSQWTYQWLIQAGGYLLRHRRRSLRAAADRSLRLLDVVSDRTWSRSNAEIGLLADADGMTAVLRPGSPARVASLPPPQHLLDSVERQPTPLVAQAIVHIGVRLDRLDGRHRAGLAASLPLAIPTTGGPR